MGIRDGCLFRGKSNDGLQHPKWMLILRNKVLDKEDYSPLIMLQGTREQAGEMLIELNIHYRTLRFEDFRMVRGKKVFCRKALRTSSPLDEAP